MFTIYSPGDLDLDLGFFGRPVDPSLRLSENGERDLDQDLERERLLSRGAGDRDRYLSLDLLRNLGGERLNRGDLDLGRLTGERERERTLLIPGDRDLLKLGDRDLLEGGERDLLGLGERDRLPPGDRDRLKTGDRDLLGDLGLPTGLRERGLGDLERARGERLRFRGDRDLDLGRGDLSLPPGDLDLGRGDRSLPPGDLDRDRRGPRRALSGLYLPRLP